MKIMNEYLVPDFGEIRTPSDWNSIPTFTKNTPFIVAFEDFVKKTVDNLGPDDFSLATIHGICASTIHPIENRYGYLATRQLQVTHMRDNPQPFLDACQRIADGLCIMAEKVLKAGADGIYFAALGAEKHFYTAEEFSRAVMPFDLQIIKTIRENNGYVLLHMCKENLDMGRFKPYEPYTDIANWGVHETHVSLEEGKQLFPNATIMGGLANRSGVLIDGSDAELTGTIHHIISSFGRRKFILGADCTLPTELPYKRIRTAVKAAEF
jgi:uroporphyrinogen decarboxylase